MPVTTFQSIVSAQTVGTADIDKLASSFDKLSGSIDNATANSNKLAQHPGFDDFAQKLKQGIQDPLGAAGNAVEGLLTTLGPMGTGIAAAGGAFVAAGVAIFGAAKSLGEWGIAIQNVELRTGLSAKEIGQFSFAAKAAGQDVSIFERLMRGLTSAMEDNSPKGEKARATLRGFGVDIAAVRNGSASTADVLGKVSDGLNALPTQFERNKAAIDLFKRAGIEALPVLLELRSSLKTASDNDFGFTESEVASAKAYAIQVGVIEQKWANIVRHMKEAIVAPAAGFLGTWAGDPKNKDFWDNAKARGYSLGAMSGTDFTVPGGFDAYRGGNLGNVPTLGPRTAPPGYGQGESLPMGAGNIGPRWNGWDPGTIGNALMAQQQKADRDRLDAQIAGVMAPSTTEDQLKEVQRKLAESKLEPGVSSASDISAYQQLSAQKDDLENQIRNGKLANGIMQTFLDTLDQIAKKVEDINSKYTTDLLTGGSKLYGTDSGLIPGFAQGDIDAFENANLNRSVGRSLIRGRFDPVPDMSADVASGYYNQIAGQVDYRALNNDRDTARRGISLYSGQASLAGVSQTSQIQDTYNLRVQYAAQERKDLTDLANLKALEAGKEEEAEKMRSEAISDEHQKLFDADMERAQALLQIANQQKQGFQSFATGAFRSIVSGARSKEGAGASLDKFLEGQLMDLADKVVSNGAGAAWGSISKAIPNLSGVPMIGQLFQGTALGGVVNPQKVSTDLNTSATIDNTAALHMFTSNMGGPGGGGGGSGMGFGFSPAWGGSSTNGGGGGGPDIITSGGDGPLGDINWGSINPMTTPSTAGPQFGLGNALGIGGAVAGGAMGIYSGIKSGGAQGDLEAAGSAAGMVGGIMSQLGALSSTLSTTLGPIGMALGAGLGLASLFLGDPKSDRQTAETNTIMAARYTAPTPTNYTMDTSGTSSSMNVMGGFQPGQASPNAAPLIQVIMPVQTMSSQSFIESGPQLAASLSTVLESNLSARFSTALRNTVGVQ